MSNLPTNRWLAGADGCRGGWLVALSDGTACEIAMVPRFTDVVALRDVAVIAIDMPIGLAERTGIGGRAAENAIRPLLGARQSSVFSVPSRAAVEAADYCSACDAALATSDPPRKVSKQLYNIAPKIREIDAVLRANARLAASCYEVHPELAFWRLNGERPLSEPKKVKSRIHEPGMALRKGLLTGAGLPPGIVSSTPPKGAATDDLLDALACLAVARRIAAGLAQPFPDPPPTDAFGLKMAIWA